MNLITLLANRLESQLTSPVPAIIIAELIKHENLKLSPAPEKRLVSHVTGSLETIIAMSVMNSTQN